MNRVAIFLRSKLKVNRFSDAVLAALNQTNIDSAILCSGFFQEDSSYRVSHRKFSGITRCCSKIDLTTVGYYSSRDKKKYQTFLTGLKAVTCPICVNVKSLRMPGDRWHAKVFIAKEQGAPVFAAIGSSNITRRAFDTYKSFNYECDVLFWDESKAYMNDEMQTILGEQSDEFPSVIVTNYDQTHPTSRVPLNQRLLALEKEILAKAVIF